ncbi:MAG: bile acid:sodium symporter [Polyangiales bacterium]
MIGGVEKALLAVLLLVLMTGMGATLTPKSFRDVASRPKGVLIGLLSQFGWMPLIAFGLASGLGLSPALAVGLIIVGCTPGGTTSNLFAYYSRADVALSISMTVVSTVVAVVAMPLLVAFYVSSVEGLAFDVPLKSIATTLALVLVPVGIGMGIRAKSEVAAKRAEKLGSWSGVAVLVVLIASSVWRNQSVFVEIPAGGYVAAFLLGLIGLIAGYGVSALLRLPEPQRRAVALETGIQNSPLAFAIVLSALPETMQDEAIRLPMLYALFVLLSASAASWLFQVIDRPKESPDV